MKLMRQVLTLCALIGAAVGVSSSIAADIPKAAAGKEAPKMVVAKAAPQEAPKDLVLKGDAKCTSCHDEADAPGLLAIGKTKHGTVADGGVLNFV